jgi:hypothetical protein
MRKSSTLNFIISPKPQLQVSLAELFFNQEEKNVWKKTQSTLNKWLKSPSNSSLRVIREHSLKTNLLLQA